MKKIFLGTIAIVGCISIAQAQSQLSGKVVDKSGNPISGAIVSLQSAKGQIIHKIADENGLFLFSTINPNAKFEISAKEIGYNQWVKDFTTLPDSSIQIVLEEAQYMLEPLEIRSVRASEKAPFTKTEISAKDIEKVNLGQDLPFILNQTPSVIVTSDAGNGIGYTSIKVRGSDPSRTNITINGIPYNDAESLGAYFVDVPDVASSASSIQIQRGAGTSTNGAGAFGASVNINTNEIHEKAYATLSNSYGTFNSWKNTVNAGTGLINHHFYADVRLSHIQSDGYIQRASTNLQSLLFSTGYVNEKTSIRFNLISGKEKTYQAWNGVPADMMSQVRNYNMLGVIDSTHSYKDQTDNYTQTHYQLFFNQKLSDKIALNVNSFLSRGKGYYQEYKTNQNYSNYGLAFPVIGSDTIKTTDLTRQRWLDNYFYGQTFALQYKYKRDNVDLGGSWTKYDGKHYGFVNWTKNGGSPLDYKYYGDLPAHKYDQNVYLKWLHSFASHWNSFIDLQYRHVKHVINGYDDETDLKVSRSFNFFNPKAGISYTNNGYNAYFSYALANKEPSRADMQNVVANVTREQLHDFELGITKTEKNYNWGATIYYMNYRDQLVNTGKMNDVGAYTNVNVPKSYRAGIELQGGYTFSKWANWNGNLTFSKNKIKSYTAYFDEYDAAGNWIDQKAESLKNTDISFSPNIIGAYTLNLLPFKNIEFSLLGKYLGKQYLDNTQDESRKINDYYNQDVRLTWSIKSHLFKEIDIIGYMYNAFSKKYNTNGAAYPSWQSGDSKPTNDNYYFPYALRHYMIGINIKL